MAGYTRQSTFSDGDTITAAIFNNEYNAIANAFHNQTGHKHDGTAAEGPVIGVIGDAGVVTPLNKVLIDTTNDHIDNSGITNNVSGSGVTSSVVGGDSTFMAVTFTKGGTSITVSASLITFTGFTFKE